MKTLATAKRGLVLALCGYECLSVATGRTPTLSALCERYRALGPALVLGLAIHLAWQPRPQVAGDCLMCPEPF